MSITLPAAPAASRSRTVPTAAAPVPSGCADASAVARFRSYYPRPLPAAEVVRRAGLEGIESRRFGALSGGQRQRVQFGLALCGDPDLVFLDEPTVGMDLQSRRRLWDACAASPPPAGRCC